MMPASFVRRMAVLLVSLLVVLAPLLLTDAARGTGITISYHKNSLWTSIQVGSLSWHGSGYSEDALDLLDPDCEESSGCNTAYFRSQGLGQYSVEYTLSTYGGSYCTGRVYTMNYYANNQWNSLIRLNFVHLKNMRSSSQGQLSYYHDYAEWVGDVAHSQDTPNCAWTAPHLHYSRSTNYGLNVHNGASGFGDAGSWVGSNEVVFVACQTSC